MPTFGTFPHRIGRYRPDYFPCRMISTMRVTTKINFCCSFSLVVCTNHHVLKFKLAHIVLNYSQKVHNTGKKSRFFKVFKIPGKIFITTVKQKIKKKTVNEEVQMTMVNFKRKVLNDQLMDTSKRVVEMTAGGCG